MERRLNDFKLHQDDQAGIVLALAICAYDGYISDVELSHIARSYQLSTTAQSTALEGLLESFFEDDSTIEEIFAATNYSESALNAAEDAATSDGLDIKENLALQKCYALLKEQLNETKG